HQSAYRLRCPVVEEEGRARHRARRGPTVSGGVAFVEEIRERAAQVDEAPVDAAAADDGGLPLSAREGEVGARTARRPRGGREDRRLRDAERLPAEAACALTHGRRPHRLVEGDARGPLTYLAADAEVLA